MDGVWELDDGEQPEYTPRLHLNAHLARELDKSSSNPKGTAHVQFRCPEYAMRRIDEILAAGHPALKTRTDVFIDAVFLWLSEWDKSGYADGANGMLRAQFALFKMELERLVQTEFLEKSKQLFEFLRNSGDVVRMENMYQQLSMVHSDTHMNAPQSYLDELENLMLQVKRLIDASKKRAE